MNLENQYDRIFFKYLYYHLHDKHAAEDLTQEAFLRFFGGAGRIRMKTGRCSICIQLPVIFAGSITGTGRLRTVWMKNRYSGDGKL